MKLFKLVVTGTVILMCILMVIIKKTRVFAQSLQHAVTIVPQENAEPDSITDYPFNITAPLRY
jgi:hypothetical protein